MEAEFGISIGAKISEYLVEPLLISPLRPIFCFGSIVDDFHLQKARLTAIQERVGNDVQRDSDNARVIYDHVKEWLQNVNAAMQEVQRLENELVQNKSCFRYSWCPNWTYHYCFSRQVSKMAATMQTLCLRGSFFISVSHPPALHQDIIGSSSSPSFIHSQSSRSAFDHIMEALKRDDVNLIKLYGRAGAGKTTMAQLVGEEAQKLCYRVIMVPITQYPLVRSQQGFVADFLGLQLEQLESEEGRAAKLQRRLKNGEKILIIFDDVQKEFNLGAIIGIPSSECGCKFLLTTRHQTAADIHVQTQKNIQLGVFSEDEAWTLFKSIAGVGDEVRTHDVAKDALEQCNGLPKAIVAMGTVLNGKDVHEWGETLLQHNAAKFKFIDSLEEGVKKLSLRQDRVNIKINTAKEKDEKIYADVEKWLKDVERVLNDVEQFKNELNQNRWCLDELGVATRVEALATRVKDLHEQGNFDQLSHPTPLEPGMRLLSSEDFLFSEAAKSAFHQILEAFKTDGVNMIGLYGMGGIGKTTLASQVHNEVIRQNALAVMVTVSQKPDVGNMQDKIADVLNLEFEKKTLEGRARELKNRLKDKKILIILDDVWKRLDLGSIGISTLADCKGCKILLTTRGRDVCSTMNCQSEIQLCLFSDDESQKLFKKKAGLLELDDVGKQIVAECKCLPIALETVGAALKGKGKDEREEALEKIRAVNLVDIIGIPNDEKNVYSCLRLSYDYLNDQAQGSEAQFILLLCSLFPEDYEIEVEDLARYAFGMKLFGKVKSVKDSRRKVRVAIRFLRGSCLLLDAGGEKYVKLHDVVRDVLLWIGGTEPRGRNTFTVRDDDHLKDLMRKKSFQNCKALSFTSDVIPKFSKYSELEFPNLEIVLILGVGFVEFGEGFFEHMKLLKVLDVRGFSSLIKCEFAMPQSLHCLENLRTLLFRYCECSKSSILRDLGRLRILSLLYCGIDCGVEIVSGLKKLRLLDLSLCWIYLNSDVTERLVKLEELYGCTWEKCRDKEGTSSDIEGTSSKLSELKLPSTLVALSLEVEDVRCLPRDFCFAKLESYDIHIGKRKSIGDLLSSTREVRRLVLGNVMMKTCEKLLPTVQVLSLSECDDLYSLPSLSLQELESLEVEGCKKMEWVLKVGNVGSSVQILSLEKLHLSRLNELRHIWEGPTRLLSLCNLTKVEIYHCPKLICIFPSPSLATSLQQLEFLIIRCCDNLEDIFSGNDDDDDDDDFTCCCFTNLKELKVSRCGQVKTIFPLMKSTSIAPPQSHRCRLPKLQEIVVEDNFLLEHIFGHQNQAEEGLDCPSLQVLKVNGCPELICIFPFLVTTLQQLEILHIHGCDNLEEIFSRRGGNDDDFTCCCFTNLRDLYVSKCHKVKAIFPFMKSTSRAPHLHSQSHRCRLPKLQEIVVEDNSLLEHLFGHQTQAEEGVECPSLQVLKVSHCGKLRTIFPISIALPKLEELELKSNAELEHVCGRSDWDCTMQCPSLEYLCLENCPKLCIEFAACTLNPSTTEAVKKNKLAPIQGDNDDLVTSTSKTWNSTSTHLIATQLQAPSSKSYVQRRHDDLSQNTIICLSFLNRVELKACNKLKQVFTTSIVNSLHLLEVLIVEGCNELEQVVNKVGDGKEEPTIRVCFEKLKTLRVSHCGKLKTIFPISISLPKLEEFELNSNEELEQVVNKVGDGKEEPTIRVCFEKLKTLRVSHCGKLKTIFPISISLPKLQRLQLKSNAELEHVFGRSDWDCNWQCPFLKDLFLEDCPKLLTEFAACILNPSSTEVVKNIQRDYDNEDDDNEDDVKCIQRGQTQNICFADLYQIKVIGCHKLKHLFTTKVATNVPNLKRLIVRRCDELEEVITCEDGKKEGEKGATTEMIGKVGFEKLHVLHVSGCKKLKTVFSTFIPLPKLHTLLLQSNAALESLFGRSECDYTSHWTELDVLSVTGCPKLCTETIAIIKSQLRVQSTRKEVRIINLSNIQGVEELIQLPKQEEGGQTTDLRGHVLKAEELGDLKRIWSGPTQDISFSFVVALRVIGCSRLKQLFTTTMATSLCNLFLLSVERCHDLEQIIEEEGNEENDTQSVQQLEFPRLRILRLIDLPKLVSFCSTSCNLVFPYLTEKNLKVKDCPKPITDFFSKQSYFEGEDDEFDVEYDSEGEEDKDDEEDGKFDDERNTEKFALAILGLRLKN